MTRSRRLCQTTTRSSSTTRRLFRTTPQKPCSSFSGTSTRPSRSGQPQKMKMHMHGLACPHGPFSHAWETRRPLPTCLIHPVATFSVCVQRFDSHKLTFTPLISGFRPPVPKQRLLLQRAAPPNWRSCRKRLPLKTLPAQNCGSSLTSTSSLWMRPRALWRIRRSLLLLPLPRLFLASRLCRVSSR